MLRVAPFQSFVDESFWPKLSSLKLNELGVDDSPLPISGFYASCSHSRASNNLTLLVESLPGKDEQSSSSRGNRKRCSAPGTMYNTNTFEAYHALDMETLLKQKAQKIWDDICSGKTVEDAALLSQFLVISFADLKKWSFHYWFAFLALVLDPPAVLIDLKPASQWLTLEEAESVSAACNAWRTSTSTTDVPYFLVSISSNSHASVLHLKEWGSCQGDGQKVLFGFYDPCHLQNNPGWPLRNFHAFIYSKWNIKNVPFLCYQDSRGFPDLGLSLVGESLIDVSQGKPIGKINRLYLMQLDGNSTRTDLCPDR